MEAASSIVSFFGISATASSLIAMSSAKEPIRSSGGRALDLVADFEAPHVTAGLNYDSGHIIAQNEG